MPRKSATFLPFNVFLAAAALVSQWLIAAASPPALVKHAAPTLPSGHVRSARGDVEPASLTAETILYPSDDAPVRAGAPNTTAPDDFLLGAGYDDGTLYGTSGQVRSYLRFDLSSLPPGSTIVSATLHLYQNACSDYEGATSTVTWRRVTAGWSETSITWNNKPGYAEAVGSITSACELAPFGLELTSPVNNWVNGSQPNYGLVAIGPESTPGLYRAYVPKGYVHQPELRVHYLPVPPPVLDAWPGNLATRASSTRVAPAPPLQIGNVTWGTLNWSASKVSGVSWLTLDKSSGSAAPTTPDALTFNLDPAGLAPGVYTEQIRVSSSTPNVAGSPLTVTFSLQVVNQLSSLYLPLAFKSGGSASAPQIAALVIGIADYQQLGPPPQVGTWPDEWGYDLGEPGHDADDLVALMQTEFRVPPGNIIQMGDSPAHNPVLPATRANAIAAFGALDQMENENTTVIIYYSGHGAQNPDVNGDESDALDELIAMVDTNRLANGVFVQVLTDDDLEGLLSSLESKRIIVILDSCFSGSLMSASAQADGSGDTQARHLVNPPRSVPASGQASVSELIGPGRLIITGGTGDQLTWESSSLQNGVFTYFFLQGLRDALHDVNHNGRISAEEAFWFTRDAVDDWIFNVRAVHQNPAIGDRYFGQADLAWLP